MLLMALENDEFFLFFFFLTFLIWEQGFLFHELLLSKRILIPIIQTPAGVPAAPLAAVNPLGLSSRRKQSPEQCFTGETVHTPESQRAEQQMCY